MQHHPKTSQKALFNLLQGSVRPTQQPPQEPRKSSKKALEKLFWGSSAQKAPKKLPKSSQKAPQKLLFTTHCKTASLTHVWLPGRKSSCQARHTGVFPQSHGGGGGGAIGSGCKPMFSGPPGGFGAPERQSWQAFCSRPVSNVAGEAPEGVGVCECRRCAPLPL